MYNIWIDHPAGDTQETPVHYDYLVVVGMQNFICYNVRIIKWWVVLNIRYIQSFYSFITTDNISDLNLLKIDGRKTILKLLFERVVEIRKCVDIFPLPEQQRIV